MEPSQTLSHLSFAFKSTCYHKDIQTLAGAHPGGQVIWYPWSKRWWLKGGGGFIQQQTQQILAVPWSVPPSPAHNKGRLFCKGAFILNGIFAKKKKKRWCWEGKGEAGLVLKKWDEKGPRTWVQVTRKSELDWWKTLRDTVRKDSDLALNYRSYSESLIVKCKHQCERSRIIVKNVHPSSTYYCLFKHTWLFSPKCDI